MYLCLLNKNSLVKTKIPPPQKKKEEEKNQVQSTRKNLIDTFKKTTLFYIISFKIN